MRTRTLAGFIVQSSSAIRAPGRSCSGRFPFEVAGGAAHHHPIGEQSGGASPGRRWRTFEVGHGVERFGELAPTAASIIALELTRSGGRTRPELRTRTAARSGSGGEGQAHGDEQSGA